MPLIASSLLDIRCDLKGVPPPRDHHGKSSAVRYLLDRFPGRFLAGTDSNANARSVGEPSNDVKINIFNRMCLISVEESSKLVPCQDASLLRSWSPRKL
jgi:hypothetical protein